MHLISEILMQMITSNIIIVVVYYVCSLVQFQRCSSVSVNKPVILEAYSISPSLAKLDTEVL